MVSSILAAGANPNVNVPKGWKFTMSDVNQLTLSISKKSSPSIRLAYGFVAFVKHADSYDTETGLQLTVVLKIPFQYDSEQVRIASELWKSLSKPIWT